MSDSENEIYRRMADTMAEPRTMARDALAGDEARRSVLFGRNAHITLDYTAKNPFPLVRSPIEEDAQPWTIEFQQFSGTPVTLMIRYGVGHAQFTRVTLMNDSPEPTRFVVHARYVEIGGFVQAFDGNAAADVAVGISPGCFSGIDYYSTVFQRISPDAAGGQLYGGAGAPNVVICQIHVIYQAIVIGGAVQYPMVFDHVGAPSGGATPILTLRSVKVAGDDAFYGDEFKPCGLFTKSGGIYVALSSTPDGYTAVASGEIVVEGKIGS